jgi:two-component sensor histidine kinase
MKASRRGPVSIRVRLGMALALALAPVLLLGLVQAGVAFQHEDHERRVQLASAAERSATAARARIDSAVVMLQTSAPAAAGPSCPRRLAEVMARSEGFANVIRFDRDARVACAAAPVLPSRSDRRGLSWFKRLQAGDRTVVEGRQRSPTTGGPALLAAVRSETDAGEFDGAMVAVVHLQSLRPAADRSLPAGSQVALADRQGRLVSMTDPSAFAPLPRDWTQTLSAGRSLLYYARDGKGERRVITAAPLLRQDVYVVLSAPAPGPFSWARLNLISSVLLPLLAFAAAFAAVWWTTETVVVRWLHYLQRVAGIYAKGRFSVRPQAAERAPVEIGELARALSAMADTIAARDHALHDTLDQKDSLMREIHHRVKNNLQVITSLLSMQQRALTDPTARAAMSDTRQRINALALIYRALYQSPNLKRVDIRYFLRELIAQLVNSEHEPGAGVNTELDADDLVIDPDKLAPVALFAVEAITNAQKHAFAGRGGLLRVRFKVTEEEADLQIADSGSGRPYCEPEGGVGRLLMNAFARQLRGRMEVAENEIGGCTVRLIFPTPEVKPAAEARPRSGRKGNRAAG